MKKVIERNEFFLNWIVADLKQGILFIPKRMKDNSNILCRGEARLYFQYKNRYPTFKEVIV